MFMLLIGFRYVYASLSLHERHLFLPCAWSPDDRALFYHDMRLIDVTHEVPTSLLFVFSPLLLFDVRVFQCKFAAARVYFSRRISWESSTFCRCKHLSIRSPFVACLFSFAAFLGKARPFADAGTCRNVLPLKEVLRRRSHRSLYVFAFCEFAPAPLSNTNMKCRCEYWSGSLGAFIRALTPISKDDQSLPKRKKPMIGGKRSKRVVCRQNSQ